MTMFQKRHYEVIADTLAICEMDDYSRLATIAEFCQTFARDNPLFDADKFKKRCRRRGG